MFKLSDHKQIWELRRNNVVAVQHRRLALLLGLVFLMCMVVYNTSENQLRLGLDHVNTRNSKPVQNTCAEANKNPKVALMFLSVERLHNEPVWRAFFEAAGRLHLLHEPSTKISDRTKQSNVLKASESDERAVNQQSPESHENREWLDCSDQTLMIKKEADRFMSRDWDVIDLIDRQSLFSVYVNSLAYDEIGDPSIFSSYVIEETVDPNSNTDFSPVLAALRMIEAALINPCNQKFVLLLESSVPIQPPEIIHAQLISETQSRINACYEGDHNLFRWNPEIVNYWEWRKSYQSFALTRSHAQIAFDDIEMQNNFNEYCFIETSDTFVALCLPDEHFFPTVLAHHGLDDQTDCLGYVTSEKWQAWVDPWNPVSYEAADINSNLLRNLADYGVEEEQRCDVEQARATTAAIYGGFSSTSCIRRYFPSNNTPNKSHWMLQQGYHPLQYPCPMFARKFSASVVRETLESALSCEATGLGYWCY